MLTNHNAGLLQSSLSTKLDRCMAKFIKSKLPPVGDSLRPKKGGLAAVLANIKPMVKDRLFLGSIFELE